MIVISARSEIIPMRCKITVGSKIVPARAEVMPAGPDIEHRAGYVRTAYNYPGTGIKGSPEPYPVSVHPPEAAVKIKRFTVVIVIVNIRSGNRRQLRLRREVSTCLLSRRGGFDVYWCAGRGIEHGFYFI